MQHDRQGCIAAFQQLMPNEHIRSMLELKNNKHAVLLKQYETGQCCTNDFLDYVLSLSKSGTTEQQVIDAWNKMHAGVKDSTWSRLQQLRANGYHLYLMSNTNDIHWQHTLSLYADKIAEVFDEVFLSFKVGLAKPDKAFFVEVNRHITTDAIQTLFVDDMEVNRIAAQQSVGWQTFDSMEALCLL